MALTENVARNADTGSVVRQLRHSDPWAGTVEYSVLITERDADMQLIEQYEIECGANSEKATGHFINARLRLACAFA